MELTVCVLCVVYWPCKVAIGTDDEAHGTPREAREDTAQRWRRVRSATRADVLPAPPLLRLRGGRLRVLLFCRLFFLMFFLALAFGELFVGFSGKYFS